MVAIIRQGKSDKYRNAKTSDLLIYASKSLNHHSVFSLVYKITDANLHGKSKVGREYEMDRQKVEKGEVIILSSTTREGLEGYLGCKITKVDLEKLGIEPVHLYRVRANILRSNSRSDGHLLFK